MEGDKRMRPSSQSTILPERNVYIDEKKRGGKLFLVGIKRVVFVLRVIGRQAGRGGGYLLLHVRHTRLTYRRCKSIIVLTEIILKSTKKLKVPILFLSVCVSRYLYFFFSTLHETLCTCVLARKFVFICLC